MHKSVNNLNLIQKLLKEKAKEIKMPKIVAVSKTFPISDIQPLLEYGHIDFGENKIQEAIEKWSSVRENYQNIKLHMIGKLQTNKVKFLLPLFDYFHSLDNLKLAKKISEEETKKNKKLKIFIQVNIGAEDQKSGINKNEIDSLVNFCRNLELDVIGLMCIPPFDTDPDRYFQEMSMLNKKFHFNDLSMGMSSDYLKAIKKNATYLRIGSSIFGQRS